MATKNHEPPTGLFCAICGRMVAFWRMEPMTLEAKSAMGEDIRKPFVVQVCSNCDDIDPNDDAARKESMRLAGHKVD